MIAFRLATGEVLSSPNGAASHRHATLAGSPARSACVTLPASYALPRRYASRLPACHHVASTQPRRFGTGPGTGEWLARLLQLSIFPARACT